MSSTKASDYMEWTRKNFPNLTASDLSLLYEILPEEPKSDAFCKALEHTTAELLVVSLDQLRSIRKLSSQGGR